MITTSEHRPARPEWRCAACAADWPCDPARKLLAEAYRNDITELARHLTGRMVQAAGELGVAHPAALYRRFVGWILTPHDGCRVCGKSGHDTIPGAPPRLIPCKRELPI